MKIDFFDFDVMYHKDDGYYKCIVYDSNNRVSLQIKMNLCKEDDLVDYIVKKYYDIFYYDYDGIDTTKGIMYTNKICKGVDENGSIIYFDINNNCYCIYKEKKE